VIFNYHGMTFYIQYGSLSLTCAWRADGILVLRCRRMMHHAEGLHVSMGDTLLIKDKRGRERWICGVQSFSPHIQYGRFTHSGTVTCSYVIKASAD